jgi:hypothetical protein
MQAPYEYVCMIEKHYDIQTTFDVERLVGSRQREQHPLIDNPNFAAFGSGGLDRPGSSNLDRSGWAAVESPTSLASASRSCPMSLWRVFTLQSAMPMALHYNASPASQSPCLLLYPGLRNGDRNHDANFRGPFDGQQRRCAIGPHNTAPDMYERRRQLHVF